MQAGHLDKYREVKMEYREVKKKVANRDMKTVDGHLVKQRYENC